MKTNLRGSARVLLLALAVVACSCGQTVPNQPDVSIGCPVLPADNVWNARIDQLPVDHNSELYVNTIGPDRRLHPDFHHSLWKGAPIGIPFVVVAQGLEGKRVRFDYGDESDRGLYPIPADVPIEGGQDRKDGDRHVVIIEQGSCKLYELYGASLEKDGSWHAGSGAIFDLRSNVLRRQGMTSADAAGLPIFPGLVRYSEVASGEIRHALRFTAPRTRNDHDWPARHHASRLSDEQYPPMGQRFRLKASVDLSHYSREARIVLRALQQYGMFLADNGGPWFLSGTPDGRWSDRLIDDLKTIKGADFEAVDEFSLRANKDSGQVRPK